MSISREQELFLSVVSDHLGGRKSPKPDGDVDFKQLYVISARQSLAGMIFYQLESYVPVEYINRYRTARDSDNYLYDQRTSVMKKIGRALDVKRIGYVIIKGDPIAEKYPVPAFRTMGDVDIAVRAKDMKRADEVLMSFGCERIIDNPDVYTYKKWIFGIELHRHIFYEDLIPGFDHKTYFDGVWEHVKNGKIDDSYHFVYLVAHAAKHIVNGGCGIRQFTDLAVCLPFIDADYVRKELKTIGLLSFAESAMDFLRRAFGITVPFGKGTLNDELYEEMAERLFGGTFGRTEKDGSELLAAQMKHSGKSSVGAAFSLTLRRIFPSYSNMWYVKQYSFLKGRPWLLPVGWVYRWFYLLFHRDNVQTVSPSDLAPAERENAFFAKIGL